MEILVTVFAGLALVGVIVLLARVRGDDSHELAGRVADMRTSTEGLSRNVFEIRGDLERQLSANRTELGNSLALSAKTTNDRLTELTEKINEKFDRQFKDLQESNEKKLAQIQQTVDEKLQKTLNERISQSFLEVSKLLSEVGKGLGEMRNLASDVGNLQRVMTGVKTRGIIGEIQLEGILEQILTKTQYREQESIDGSNRVDFAVVLPGQGEGEEVLLPIDSKFPMENYQRLAVALEANDAVEIELARKALFADIRTQAKSIHEKYILPPKTTDFAMMFLPTEGLFMEVVNNPGLYEQVNREHKVNIVGPTTMTAVLNSLQFGFKTLQIEKKSSEVYNVLREVRTEFDKFAGQLEKVHKRIQDSEKDISVLMTTRTNTLNRKLNKIEALDAGQSAGEMEMPVFPAIESDSLFDETPEE